MGGIHGNSKIQGASHPLPLYLVEPATCTRINVIVNSNQCHVVGCMYTSDHKKVHVVFA